VELALVGGGYSDRCDGGVTAWWRTGRSDRFSHCRRNIEDGWRRFAFLHCNCARRM